MNQPKFHHYVPQVLLRRFADRNGLLHFYDARQPELGVRASTPKNLLGETHLYSAIAEDGSRHSTLELEFSALESRVKPVLDHIESALLNGSEPRLTANARSTLIEFLHTQWRRVPEFTSGLMTSSDFEDSLEASIDSYESMYRPLTADERSYFNDPMTRVRMRQNTMVDVLRNDSPNVRSVLASRALAFATPAQPSASFVTGSVPVVKLTLGNDHRLNAPHTEVWLALAARIAVCSFGGEADKGISIPPAFVRNLNLSVARQGRFLVGRSQALIASLARAR